MMPWHPSSSEGTPDITRDALRTFSDGFPAAVLQGAELRLDANHHEPYTHYLFKFPAKFHPPLIRWLITNYSRPGSLVVDPAVGSGTTLVESIVLGRSAVGLDVDPLSCYIARAKSEPLNPRILYQHWESLLADLDEHERAPRRYEQLKYPNADISHGTFRRQARGLPVPEIPNLLHWFRRYVVIDLAHIRAAIESLNAPPRYRRFFLACFAAIIRRCSNADPTPVSGLEVTRYMRELDSRGRLINPYRLFRQKVTGEIASMASLSDATSPSASARVILGNALHLRETWQRNRLDLADLVVTSPPYCNAVEYNRRHKLEMFWLDLVDSSEALTAMSQNYIGRRWRHTTDGVRTTPTLTNTLAAVEKRSEQRANALRSYFGEMDRFLSSSAAILKRRRRCIVVVGDSVARGVQVPTHQIIGELGQRYLDLELHFSYEIRNRYMQYFRRNGANIKRDHVLVFKKR